MQLISLILVALAAALPKLVYVGRVPWYLGSKNLVRSAMKCIGVCSSDRSTANAGIPDAEYERLKAECRREHPTASSAHIIQECISAKYHGHSHGGASSHGHADRASTHIGEASKSKRPAGTVGGPCRPDGSCNAPLVCRDDWHVGAHIAKEVTVAGQALCLPPPKKG